MLGGETCKATCEGIRLCTKQWYIVRVLIDINYYDCVYFAKGASFAFSSGYMIPPRYWEQFIQFAFSMHQRTAVELELWRL